MTSLLEIQENMKRQKSEDELPIVGTYYWRRSEKTPEKYEVKKTMPSSTDMTGDGNKIDAVKKQYYIGAWDVRSLRIKLSGQIERWPIGG